MNKAYLDKQPKAHKFVQISPDILRNVATHLEHQSKLSQPGDTVTIELSPGIMLFCLVEPKPMLEKKAEAEEIEIEGES